MHAKYQLVDLKGRPHERGVDGKNILKWILDEMEERICVFLVAKKSE
jgi:hypothetical protein